MICPNCQAKNPEENKICFDCGADLSEKDPFGGMKTTLGTENIESQFKKGTLFAGRYEILEDGLKGGMGMVFKVKDNTLGKIKALKLILPQYLENESAISRFKQEVAITQEFNNENIVRVHDIGESEGVLFFSMEWIDGISLRDFINERKKHGNYLSLDEIIYLMRQICSALSYAHKSIIHRDIKPENILIIDAHTKNPKIKITDFGIAKADSPALHKSLSSYMGTPIYMAPEQYTDAAHVDKRADVFSLGVILYELSTLLPPLGSFPMPSEVNTALPKRIDDIVEKALNPDRTKRYNDVSEIIRELEIPAPQKTEDFGQNPVPDKKPKSKLFLILALILVGLLSIAIIIIINSTSIFQYPDNTYKLPPISMPGVKKHVQSAEPPFSTLVKGQIREEKPLETPSPSQPLKKPDKDIKDLNLAEVPSAGFSALINAPIEAKRLDNTPLEIEVNILGQRKSNNVFEEVVVKEGLTLKSNDNLQIHIRSSRDCYIYVLLYDSQGKANLIFPGQLVPGNNKIKGGKNYQIPTGNKWFYLDESPGTETIYVMANLTPMADTDNLLLAMEEKGKPFPKETSQKILAQVKVFKARGIGGVAEGATRIFRTSGGENISNVTQVVKGMGAVVWSLSFKHI